MPAALGLLLMLATPAAQIAVLPAAPATATPYAADHSSIESIIAALYAAISGDADQKRDWARFRALFHPDARLIPTGRRASTGQVTARVQTPEQYITTSGPYLEREGFHESEVGRRVDRFGHIAQVFSTYEGRRKRTDATPFLRGINGIQLFNDGARWWILSVTWSQETPETPIPAEYKGTSG